MRIRLFFLGYLFFTIQQLNSQPVLLKEQVLRSVLHFQQEGLVDLPAKELSLLKKSPSLFDTSWKSSAFFQLAVRTAYALSIGKPIKPRLAYEAISPALKNKTDLRMRLALEKVQTPHDIEEYFSAYYLPRSTKTKTLYEALFRKEREYKQRPSRLLADTIQWLRHAHSIYHWIDHWDFAQLILVDVAAAEVQLIEQERSILLMRAVVGKPSTPTPFFAAWAESIILYPYWFVPSSIAIGEFLPKIKKDPSWLERQNMQVIDKHGSIVDPKAIAWSTFDASYFPFTLRQSTGCDNALGILKIDVKTPLGVYLHDTNNRGSFLSTNRFLSHGCIRIEEPLLLGNYLLDAKLDTTFLQACLKEQQPVHLPLAVPIPVLVFYSLVRPLPGGGIRYLKDTYKLFGKK